MNSEAMTNPNSTQKITMSKGEETLLSPVGDASESSMRNANKPATAATENLPRNSSVSPMMFTAPTVRMLLKINETASHADQQKLLPSMAIMMYVLRLIHSMIFCRYHRQYCTTHAAYLMKMLSLPAFFIWCTMYATMMRMNCRSATRNEPNACESVDILDITHARKTVADKVFAKPRRGL